MVWQTYLLSQLSELTASLTLPCLHLDWDTGCSYMITCYGSHCNCDSFFFHISFTVLGDISGTAPRQPNMQRTLSTG